MSRLLRISRICDNINEIIGKVVRWLALALVIMMAINVATRYLFAIGLPWQQELVRYFHAVLFLLAMGYTLKYEGHVRVDVLYQHYSPTRRAWVNLFGTLFLLFPVAFSFIYFSWDYVLSSWAIHEGSSEYRGMPGVFLLKSCIWLGAITLFIQGFSKLCRAIVIIRNHEQRPIRVEEA